MNPPEKALVSSVDEKSQIQTGEVLARCEKRHRHQEYLRFLRLIDKTAPKQLQVHLILDNYATHKHHKVKEWFKKHPRFHLHYITTSSSWLNRVERFFGKMTTERIRRGTFKSVFELTEAIHSYIVARNRNSKPYVRTKTAEEIINKLKPVYQPSNTLGWRK